jgi:predicted RNA binding protein YcfA (HicA-like mRNA interferase family)
LSKRDKLLKRLFGRPSDFTWNELNSLLTGFGFQEVQGSGSRVKFINRDMADAIIIVHRPHPGNEIKGYVVDQIVSKLKELGIKS